MKKSVEVPSLDSINGTVFMLQFSVLRLHGVNTLEQGNLHIKKMKGINYFIGFLCPPNICDGDDDDDDCISSFKYAVELCFQGLVNTTCSHSRYHEVRN